MGVYDTPAFREAFYPRIVASERDQMNGRDYIAQVRLTNKRGDVLAMAGETCERVPPSSLVWLVEQGLIVRSDATMPSPHGAEDPHDSADEGRFERGC